MFLGIRAIRSFIVVCAVVVLLTPVQTMAMPLDGEITGPPIPREFPSLQLFEKWRDTELLLYIKEKPYRLPTETYSLVKDCDDIAEAWQRKALKDGYLISAQAIEYGRLLGVRVSRTYNKHDGIRANIGNSVYFLDTYPPYAITLVVNRD